jgi:hypothetical protein
MAESLAPAKPAPPPLPVAPNSPQQPWWRRGATVIPAALLTVAVVTVAIVVTSQQHKNPNSAQCTPPTSTQHREPTYGPQITLPFTGFTGFSALDGVAVDSAGDGEVSGGVSPQGSSGLIQSTPRRASEAHIQICCRNLTRSTSAAYSPMIAVKNSGALHRFSSPDR